MISYIQGINAILAAEIAKLPSAVVYGENIDNGSRISGMTKNLSVMNDGLILNVGNCENTHAGVGFGLMMSGMNAIMFSKQLEFILLSMDQFVNTWAFAKCAPMKKPIGSFSVVTILCDQGLQGPQSSYNGLLEICSAAKCLGYVVTNKKDASRVLSAQLREPGFKIICLSQRMWSMELSDPSLVAYGDDSSWFQYSKGNDATVICFNAAYLNGKALVDTLSKQGKTADFYSVNFVPEQDFSPLIASVMKTGTAVLIDDSKSTVSNLDRFVTKLYGEVPKIRRLIIIRRESNPDTGVGKDTLEFDPEAVAIKCVEAGKNHSE